MRTLDITIEDQSFAELDAGSRAAGLTPAEFARRATAAAVRLHKSRDASRRDISGYSANPIEDDEFAIDAEDLKRVDDEACWRPPDPTRLAAVPKGRSSMIEERPFGTAAKRPYLTPGRNKELNAAVHTLYFVARQTGGFEKPGSV